MAEPAEGDLIERAIQDPGSELILEPAVLVDAAAVLDRAIPASPRPPGGEPSFADQTRTEAVRIDTDAVERVALVHQGRAQAQHASNALADHFACLHLFILLRLISPDRALPSSVQEQVDRNLSLRPAAEQRVDDAVGEALCGHAEVLGNAARETEDRHLVEAAVRMQHRALGSLPESSPRTALAWFDLAALYSRQAVLTGRAVDRDRAVDVARQAASRSRGTHQQARAHELLAAVLGLRADLSRVRHPLRSRADRREAATATAIAAEPPTGPAAEVEG
ncbi:hypothetical protein [Actinomadura sp. NPDC048394]|uniref:hypothetical protein n=1 Tax=Actinomadura sp. NPDC048394 TaxID=3158223 RepID=UPI0033CFFEDF